MSVWCPWTEGMRVERYQERWKDRWDDFVRRSKNGTFLFLRDYMDYHRDRFADHSLMVWDKSQLLALLPANRSGDLVASHAGLTYGGFVVDEQMKTPTMLELAHRVMDHLCREGVRRFLYKTVPHIYHRAPAEEDRYALFRLGAKMYRRDVTSVVECAGRLSFQRRRLRSMRKALAAGVTCGPTDDFETYWRILEHNLSSAHGVRPVHTVTEIRRLHRLFPQNIKLFGAFLDGEMIAGTVIYESASVAHAQYIATSDRGRVLGALDLLFFSLLTDEYSTKRYFDFGISTVEDGRLLNTGLIEFKEGFGARAVVHEFYELSLG